MNYTQNKTDKILVKVGGYLVHKDATKLAKEINLILREIQKDIRHKAIENINLIDFYPDLPESWNVVSRDKVNNVIMNTRLD